MTKESLDSDRVNYLIWRYLLESDYRETAVRLQKEWNLDDPQQLPFAPHVTNHALVSVLNKGLLYNACERESARTTRDVVGPVLGVFGPLTRPRPAIDGDDFEIVRKRQVEDDQHQAQNSQASKRPRLSIGYENGFESTPKSTPMELDVDEEQNGDGNAAYPSPEQAPSPAVVTTGPEIGTQVDRVVELGSETTFLDLSDESSSAKTTILLQCEFNPRDPTVLAAAGTDALARMWTLSRTAPHSDPNDMETDQPPVSLDQPHYLSLLDERAPSSTNVTGLSWSSDGNLIAVSSEPTDDGLTANVDVWTLDGTSVASFSTFELPVMSLSWNPANTLLLAVSPILASRSALITVMVPSTQHTIHFTLPNPNDQNLEAAWTSNEEFVVCGGDMLQAFHCNDDAISALRKYETREGHALSKFTFDTQSRLLATGSDTGMIDIWDQQGQNHSFTAHQGVITSLVWQPCLGPAPLNDDSERLIASAGEDGAISIWNARWPAKSKSSMTMSSGVGVVALAFSPDGAFIAGATVEEICIWKVDDVHIPRAIWRRGSEAGWQTPRSHDSAADEDQYCLCWDADGQKLAYGVNSQLAVISFRR